MTDEYVVVVTTDETLRKNIQNATKMDVIRMIDHDSAKEKNYRRKIVILNPDTVSTTQEQLSIWHDNAHHLIVLLENHNDDFIEQNQEFISDVWFKSINSILLEKRLSTIQQSIKMKQALFMFSALTGHEVNTPLASVKGFADVMLAGMTGELTEQQQMFMTSIKQSASKTMRMFDEIRYLSRIIAESFDYELEDVSLPTVIDDLRRFYVFETIVPNRNFKVLANESKLHHILGVLLSSATYTQANEIKVVIKEGYKNVKISVSAEKEFLQIYSSFSLAGTLFESQIIEIIVEQHGGEIFVETSPETGSTFHFTIPIAKDTDK